jgi:GTPase
MLETDRRHILRRVSKLDDKLKKISDQRKLIRKSRLNQVTGAVVGYTNAGKSTLLNILAKDDLFVEDRLFATLDSYTRNVFLETGKKVLLTDTVGFIRNLPANLLESFKSTLEEIVNADFLIHVIDITSVDIEKKMETVNSELTELQCNNKPVILFFNKADSIREKSIVLDKYSNAIIGSAKDNTGIPELKQKIIKLYDNAIESRLLVEHKIETY